MKRLLQGVLSLHSTALITSVGTYKTHDNNNSANNSKLFSLQYRTLEKEVNLLLNNITINSNHSSVKEEKNDVSHFSGDEGAENSLFTAYGNDNFLKELGITDRMQQEKENRHVTTEKKDIILHLQPLVTNYVASGIKSRVKPLQLLHNITSILAPAVQQERSATVDRFFSQACQGLLLEAELEYLVHKEKELLSILRSEKSLMMRRHNANSFEREVQKRYETMVTEAKTLVQMLFPKSNNETLLQSPTVLISYIKVLSYIGDCDRCLSLLVHLFSALESTSENGQAMKERYGNTDDTNNTNLLFEVVFFSLRSLQQGAFLSVDTNSNLKRHEMSQNSFEVVYSFMIRFFHLTRDAEQGDSDTTSDAQKRLLFALLLSAHMDKNSNYYEIVQKMFTSLLTTTDVAFESSERIVRHDTVRHLNFELSLSNEEIIRSIFCNILLSFTFVNYLETNTPEESSSSNKSVLLDDLYKLVRENVTQGTLEGNAVTHAWLGAYTLPRTANTGDNSGKSGLLLNALLSHAQKGNEESTGANNKNPLTAEEEVFLLYFLSFANTTSGAAGKTYQSILAFLSQRLQSKITTQHLHLVALELLTEMEADATNQKDYYYSAVYDLLQRIYERRGSEVLLVSKEDPSNPEKASVHLYNERSFFLRLLTFYKHVTQKIHNNTLSSEGPMEFETSVFRVFLDDLMNQGNSPVRIHSPLLAGLVQEIQQTLLTYQQGEGKGNAKVAYWLECMDRLMKEVTPKDIRYLPEQDGEVWLVTFWKPISAYTLTEFLSGRELVDYVEKVKTYLTTEKQKAGNVVLCLSWSDFHALRTVEEYVSILTANRDNKELPSFTEMNEKAVFFVSLQNPTANMQKVEVDKVLGLNTPIEIPFTSDVTHSNRNSNPHNIISSWLGKWVRQFPFLYIKKGASFNTQSGQEVLSTLFRAEGMMKELLLFHSANRRASQPLTKGTPIIIHEEEAPQDDGENAEEKESETGVKKRVVLTAEEMLVDIHN
ncbi:hypothetical protein AGDE_16898 [Angomonas deanei]|nr:hypothetical protein AGDE_16898 [Angomonas deanei]|eukprot:EPY15946.1 hypothetical protein AGDE_16898 [Angomonas deanei]